MSFSFTIVSPYYKGKKTFTYRGINPVVHFLKTIEQEEKRVRNFLYKWEKKQPDLTLDEEISFLNATHCYLCNDLLLSKDRINELIVPIQEHLKFLDFDTFSFPTKFEIKRKRKYIGIKLKNPQLKDQSESLKKSPLSIFVFQVCQGIYLLVAF